MGIFPEDTQVIDQLVQLIDSKEKVHLIPVLITKERLKEAVLDLENYLKEV